MDTKARVAVLAGGLVLVGMVAWVLWPSGKSTPDQARDTTSDTGDLTLVPFDSTGGNPPVDPFAAPTTAPSVTSLDGAIPNSGVMNVGPAAPQAGAPAGTTPLAMNNTSVRVGPSIPATGSDAWGRAFEQRTSSSTISAASSLGTALETTTVLGATPTGTPTTYRIASGDSLYTISQKIYGSPKHVGALQAANPGLDPKRLKVGQTIKLPDVSSAQTAAPSATTIADNATTLSAATTGKTYKVQAGDTLQKIARTNYGQVAAWEKIYSANKSAIGSNPARLKVGMVLQLP